MNQTRTQTSDDERALVLSLGEYGHMPEQQLLKLDGAKSVDPPKGMDWRVEGPGWVASLSKRKSNLIIQGTDTYEARRAVTRQ